MRLKSLIEELRKALHEMEQPPRRYGSFYPDRPGARTLDPGEREQELGDPPSSELHGYDFSPAQRALSRIKLLTNSLYTASLHGDVAKAASYVEEILQALVLLMDSWKYVYRRGELNHPMEMADLLRSNVIRLGRELTGVTVRRSSELVSAAERMQREVRGTPDVGRFEGGGGWSASALGPFVYQFVQQLARYLAVLSDETEEYGTITLRAGQLVQAFGELDEV